MPQVPEVPMTRKGMIILFKNGKNPLKSKPTFALPVHLYDQYISINAKIKFGTAAPMIPTDLKDVNYVEEIGYEYDAHSDAAYCSALDKYILILQSARQVIMFLSDDGANWTDHVVLFTAEPDSGLTYYSTIVGMDDEATDDFSTVGHKFCVHFSHKPEFNRLPNNYGNYAKDKYYRCCVTIE